MNIGRAMFAAALAGLTFSPGTSWSAVPTATALTRAVDPVVRSMRTAADSELEVKRSPATGLVRVLSAPKNGGVAVARGATADERALAFMEQYGAAFGFAAGSTLVTRVEGRDETGLEHVRLQQAVEGIPVAGGEAIVHLRGSKVASVLARTVPDLDRVATTPVVGSAAASSATRGLLAKHLGIDNAELSTPRLEIFNPSLLDGGAFRPSRLAWFVEARTFDRREYVWVDAETGAILLNFNQMPHSRNRLVYDAQDTDIYENSLARSEGDSATGDSDTDNAYDFSGDTYDYYWTEHGRDSYDDAGATLKSTVHFCPENESTPDTYDCPYANAFWNGQRMVYGEGFASADDVVAHELTHAVTSYTAGLYYYMQSGALNESFSDIFGETVDLTNGADAPADRWLMGEDLAGGAIRDMWDPNTFYQPEKMSDPSWFYCGIGDNGGVHYNSGLPNLAYALMVDGGGFNGFTITGIELAKAAAIHYRVLTQYLVSGSDFKDHYDATNQACTDLVGTLGITPANCTEVDKALQAVEMDSPWACLPAQSGEPALCGVGEAAVDLVAYDFVESPWTDWTRFTNDLDSNWGWYSGGYSASGGPFIYGPNAGFVGEAGIKMSTDLAVPAGGAKLRFTHSYGFEHGVFGFYDGGFVLYSTDSGSNWLIADCSTCEGLSYQGTVAEGFDNPRAGETGFVGNSFGYAISQLDLGDFAGQSVRLAFDISSDEAFGDFGWAIDDIRIFECVADGSEEIFSDGFESGNTSAW